MHRLGLALSAAAAAGCAVAAASLGPTPQQARARADAALGALAARFGPARRGPSLSRFRDAVSQAALVPSRIYEQDDLWPTRGPDRRDAGYIGSPRHDGYHMSLGPVPEAPERPGEYRRALTLRRLDENQFEWQVRDELALGRLPLDDVTRSLGEVWRAIEHAPAGEVHGAWAAALPRTGRALAELWTLDRLLVEPSVHGGRGVLMRATLWPERLGPRLPHYARYLDKYVGGLRFQLAARDPRGIWWELQAHDRHLTVRFRVQHGRLAAVQGPTRSLPGRLDLRARFSNRVGLFRVGVSEVEAALQLVARPHLRAFDAVFRTSPRWHLPFLIKPFMQGALRRPFEGEGTRLSFALEEHPGRTTLVRRDYRLAVKESWIVNWLGGLASTAMSDFRRHAEAEADRYAGEVLDALRRDVVTSLPEDRRSATSLPSRP